jgi:hypothetical protein
VIDSRQVSLADSVFWKGMLERVDDQFGNDEAEAYGHICMDGAFIDINLKLDLLVIADHRGAEGLTKLVEVRAQCDIADARSRKLFLKSGDRYDPMMCIVQVGSRFLRLHLAGAHRQDAGNDLKTIRNAMLQLLKEDHLVLHQVIFFAAIAPL